MNELLKPCPFCGGTALFDLDTDPRAFKYVYCPECDTISGGYSTVEAAIEAWNSRAYEQNGGNHEDK